MAYELTWHAFASIVETTSHRNLRLCASAWERNATPFQDGVPSEVSQAMLRAVAWYSAHEDLRSGAVHTLP